MSFTGEMPRVDSAPPTDSRIESEPESECAQCGAPLRADQEWCLECGSARTLIHRPPDWRIGAALVAAVIGLALFGLAVVLVNLSSNANQVGSGAPAAATPVKAPAASTPPPTRAKPPTVASWPVGLSGWTVVLSQSHRRTAAVATARRLAAAGTRVGVLETAQHPIMKAGYWIVFSGRYPSQPQAAAAAAEQRTAGRITAVARQVAPPGGL